MDSVCGLMPPRRAQGCATARSALLSPARRWGQPLSATAAAPSMLPRPSIGRQPNCPPRARRPILALMASRLGDREHAEHKCRAAKQPADMAGMAVLSLHLSLSSTAPPFSPLPLASPSLPLPLPLPCSSSSSSSDESSSGIATLFK